MMKRLLKWTAAAVASLFGAVAVWCLIPLQPTIPAIQPRPDTQYWTMSQGYRIAFTRVLTRKPPIVFLHGGPGGYVHSSVIRTLAPLAALGHDVYFYDQIGSGLSDRRSKPKDYSFLGHVADLHEIVTRHIAAPKAILIGHSYGGQLAAQFAAMHPQSLDRLVLSSPGTLQPAQFDDEGKWINERKFVPPSSLRFVEPQYVPMDGLRFWPMRVLATMAFAMVNVKFMPDDEADAALNTLASRFTVRMVCEPANVQPEEGGAGMYAHGWSNYYGDLGDPRPLMRQFPGPVLVLQGACDYIPYPAAYEYVDLFPGARYSFVEGAGHIIWWDKPEEYHGRIAQFLGN